MTNNDSSDTAMAERLRVAREMAGLTQAQVAKMLSLHRPSISEMEAGRRKVSSDELIKLSEIYGVSLSWLTNRENEIDMKQARIELVARELSNLKAEDLERVLRLLSALRQQEDTH